jgi:hypothetical protein
MQSVAPKEIDGRGDGRVRYSDDPRVRAGPGRPEFSKTADNFSESCPFLPAPGAIAGMGLEA